MSKIKMTLVPNILTESGEETQNAKTLTFLLGDGRPLVSYDDGLGWEQVARPRRESFSDWRTRPLLHLRVAIMLDGFIRDVNVEPLWNLLDNIASLSGPFHREPPQIELAGPVPHTELTWVMDGLEWGEDGLLNTAGVLVRQSATVTLLEYREPDLIVTHKRKKRSTGKTYRVRTGDTLHSIANKELHDTKRWQEILKLNRKTIKNARHLKPNTILRLPS